MHVLELLFFLLKSFYCAHKQYWNTYQYACVFGHGCSEVHHKTLTANNELHFTFIYLATSQISACCLPQGCKSHLFFHRIYPPPTLVHSPPLSTVVIGPAQSSNYQPGEILPTGHMWVKSGDIQVVMAGDREELCAMGVGWRSPSAVTTYKAQDSPPAKAANSAEMESVARSRKDFCGNERKTFALYLFLTFCFPL